MRPIIHFAWLLSFPCVVFTIKLRAVGDHVLMHKCSQRSRYDLPRLDEASVDDLVTLQASGSVSSVDLVHACFSSLSRSICEILISKGVCRKNQRSQSPSPCGQ